MRSRRHARQSGFSLAELLVVVGILIVLLAVAVTAFMPAKATGDWSVATDTILVALERERALAMKENRDRTFDVASVQGVPRGVAINAVGGPPGSSVRTTVRFEGGTGRILAADSAPAAITLSNDDAAAAIVVGRTGNITTFLRRAGRASDGQWTPR